MRRQAGSFMFAARQASWSTARRPSVWACTSMMIGWGWRAARYGRSWLQLMTITSPLRVDAALLQHPVDDRCEDVGLEEQHIRPGLHFHPMIDEIIEHLRIDTVFLLGGDD